MKPAPFDYVSARNADHAIELLVEGGEDARVLAGGQSLVAMMNFRIARPTVLVDLARCEDLNFIRVEQGVLCIGAMTRQLVAQDNPLVQLHCPLVALVLSKAGPTTIRNRGTVGGSIANGYPVAHLPTAAVCLGAEILVRGVGGIRQVAAADFFLDAMATDLAHSEIVVECRFPLMAASDRIFFRQVSNHSGGGALCMVSVRATHDDGNRACTLDVVVAGIAGVPLRLAHVQSTAMADAFERIEIEKAFTLDLEKAGFGINGMDAHAKSVASIAFGLVFEGVANVLAVQETRQ